jgi:hypothetical protein
VELCGPSGRTRGADDSGFRLDDYPEIVTAFGGFIVSEYFIQQPADQEMYDVYHTICEHVRHGGLQTITEIVLAQHRLDERTQERAAYGRLPDLDRAAEDVAQREPTGS